MALSSSVQLKNVSSRKLLPSCFDSLKISPKSIDVILTKHENNVFEHSIKVKWIGPKIAKEPSLATEKNELSTRSSNSTDESATHKLLCDGPCKQKFLVSDLRTMGRCDHRLCKLCLGMVSNKDGSMGCSSFSCVYQARFDSVPKDIAQSTYDQWIKAQRTEKEHQIKVGTLRLSDLPLPPRYHDSNIKTGGQSSEALVRVSAHDLFAPSEKTKSLKEANLKSSTSEDTVTAPSGMFETVQKESTWKKPDSQVGKITDLFPSDFVFIRLAIFVPKNSVQAFYVGAEVPSTVRLTMAITKFLKNRIRAKPYTCYIYDKEKKVAKKVDNTNIPLSELKSSGVVHLIVYQANYVKTSKE